jgi:hypothetical protein
VVEPRDVMRGNAARGKHDPDAFHVVEAAKYGGREFSSCSVTTHSTQSDGAVIKLT